MSYDDLLTSILKSYTNHYGSDNIPVKLISSCSLSHLQFFLIKLHIPFILKNSTGPTFKEYQKPFHTIRFPSYFSPSNLSKLLEYLVRNQLSNFLEEYSHINCSTGTTGPVLNRMGGSSFILWSSHKRKVNLPRRIRFGDVRHGRTAVNHTPTPLAIISIGI